MKFKFNENLYTYIIFIFLFMFFIYIFNFLWIFLISLWFSWIIIYYLWKNKSNLTSLILVFIVILNIWVLIFSIIPTYNINVDSELFYIQQKNYLYIEKFDTDEILKENRAKLVIRNKFSKDMKQFNIEQLKNKDNFDLTEWDIITYSSKSKSLKTYVNLILWDWTIIRIFPQTTLNIDRLLVDKSDLIKSKTQVNVIDWTIWFNLIRTVFDENWFNISTKNSNIVIRWTSWIVNYKDNLDETNVYSNSHVIEIQNKNWESTYIANWQSLSIFSWQFFDLNIDDMFSKLWTWNTFIEKLNELDLKDVSNYKNRFDEFIDNNFSWDFDWMDYLSKISEIKMKWMSIFSKKDNNNLENYQKYRLLKWEQVEISQEQDLKDIIIVPLNKYTSKIKLDYLKNLWEFDKNALKTYLINSYNYLIDSWKNIDFLEFKNSLSNININDSINDVKLKTKNLMKSLLNE